MSKYPGVAGRRVVITGATSGLGFAMAEALVKEGAKVVVSGRDQAKIDDAVSSLASYPGECIGALIDVRDETSIRAALADAAQRWGGLDVLINNAGIGMITVNPTFLTELKPFWEIPSAGFRSMIDTNLTGYFLVAKEVVPYFQRAGGGRIINITVTDYTMQAKGFIPYGPSRAGTESLSHIMSKDLAEHAVKVNLLMPGGGTMTGMLPANFKKSDLANFEAKVGFKFLTPDVMAEPAVFLCSDDSADVNDERISAKDFQQWKAGWLERKRS